MYNHSVDMMKTMWKCNVKGKKFTGEKKHCGSEGQWLEDLFGISPNSNNDADLRGYEIKKESDKITFGDWSALEYLFTKKKRFTSNYMTKNMFIETFGTFKDDKKRYSWSGKCFPTYGIWNYCGQIIEFDEDNNLCIYYSYEKDKRPKKNEFPTFLKKEKKILIAIWTYGKLEKHVNKKFNKKGFIICKKDNSDVYNSICFGSPLDVNLFFEGIKKQKIYLDSGMYQGNNRNYSQFRANKDFWNSLIIEEYF